MTNRSGTLSRGRAVLVVLSLAAIIAGILVNIGWLSAAGGAGLGWIVASALLRVPAWDAQPPLQRVMLPLSGIILTGILMLVLVLYGLPSYILLPALVVG